MATARTNKSANLAQIERQFEGKTLTIEQVSNTASSFTWKELEGRFRDVQSKAPVRDRVVALFTRTESPTGSITEEWRVTGNSACRVEFEQLASIAARKLGNISTEAVTESWLGRVREWMIREKLDRNSELVWAPTGFVEFEGLRSTTQHLNTESIAELSAKFCVQLMTDGIPESAILPSSDSTSSDKRTLKSSRPNMKPKLVKPDPIRDALRKAADAMREKNPRISDLQISKVLTGKDFAKGRSRETIRRKIRKN